MVGNEKSGLFDIGRFDEARFDTVNTDSNSAIFSTETSTFNLGVSSFTNIFSDLGREIQRDLSSFVGLIDSTVDANLQKFKTVTSFVFVDSFTDFKLGKKVISTISIFSDIDSTINVLREPVSNILVNSKNRIRFTFNTSSNILINSVNQFERIFNRSTTSFLKVQSEIKDILRSAPDFSPPFRVEVKQKYQGFVQVKQKFQGFVKDNT